MSNEELNFLPGVPDFVREAFEDSDRWMKAAEPILLAGTKGMFPCNRCRADAAWERDGRVWSVKCGHCEWGAAGSLAVDKVAS